MFTVAFCVINIELVKLGMGKHMNEFDMTWITRNLQQFLLLHWVGEFVFALSHYGAKSSILFFYARVFGNIETWFSRTVWVMQILNAACFVSTAFLNIFGCKPVVHAWDIHVQGTCADIIKMYIGGEVPDLFTDLVILTMPIPLIWRLQLKISRKIQAVVAFLCGYL